ncbi:hypothetical protein EB796_016896 [Bugula neritina]|nr:hypothetical protein EB796_016896 [Bugula neritina]
MHVKPSRRLHRLVSRELLSRIETITPSTISQIYRLLSMSFAVGVDLSKSNVDRLKRKFRLDEKTDARFFKLVQSHRKRNLKLLSALAIRKQLIRSGHHNITSGLNALNPPPFLRDIISLDWFDPDLTP